MTAELRVTPTAIPGLLLLDLPVHADARGWFKENWQREKMIALGLPDFAPVQNNISFNATVGTTRGVHAEPWDKLVSVATGRIFGAWVDLRDGESFGSVFSVELGPDQAIFVPRGVGNSYQTLEPDTAYSYLVNDHWSADAQSEYTFLNLADETAAIAWPIPLADAVISDKDLAHPRLADVAPMPPKKTLILGATGQLGKALVELLPDATALGRAQFDVTDPAAYAEFPWRSYDTVINAAAYTKVDEAETEQGRRDAWAANVTAVAHLAKAAIAHHLTVVHVSSDYVFDGTVEVHHENEPFSPLGVYGQTKAAGDAIISTVPRHYIVRTSWVIGDGHNFVRTMASLAARGVNPAVVNDQWGRPTFTTDLAAAILHLIEVRAEYGTYNVTNEGETTTWSDLARVVFTLTGYDLDRVTGMSADEYFADKFSALRPTHSALALDKLSASGFVIRGWPDALAEFLRRY
jgi:dTDP-4-dehydrorhamnose reductase/dTDP-4-dehydrorhamnose 3,5-epimerase